MTPPSDLIFSPPSSEFSAFLSVFSSSFGVSFLFFSSVSFSRRDIFFAQGSNFLCGSRLRCGLQSVRGIFLLSENVIQQRRDAGDVQTADFFVVRPGVFQVEDFDIEAIGFGCFI